jgi:hypothetical protein
MRGLSKVAASSDRAAALAIKSARIVDGRQAGRELHRWTAAKDFEKKG